MFLFYKHLAIGNILARLAGREQERPPARLVLVLDAVQPRDLPIKTISTQGMIRYIVLSYRIHHGFTRFGQQNLSLEPPNTVATTNPVRGIFFESKKKENLFFFQCILVSGDVDHRLSFLENTQQRGKL